MFSAEDELERMPYGFGLCFLIQGPKVKPEQAKEIIMAIDTCYKGNYADDDYAMKVKKELNIPSMDDCHGPNSIAAFCNEYKLYKESHNLLVLDSPIWENRALLNPSHSTGWIDFEGNIFCARKLPKKDFANPYDIYDEMQLLGDRFPFLEMRVTIFPTNRKYWMPKRSILLKNQQVSIVDYSGPTMTPELFNEYNDGEGNN